MVNSGLRPWILSLVMVILGSFCFVAFAFNFVYQTNPTSDIFADKYHLNSSVTDMQDSLDDFSEATSDAQSILNKSKPSTTDYLFLIFLGAFEIPKSFLVFTSSGINSIITLVFDVTLGSVGNLEGFEPLGGILVIISGVIMTGLLLTVIFLIIKAIRSGESG